MSVSRGKHRLAHQIDVGRGCRQREPGQARVTCTGGYSARPDLRPLRSRQAPSPSPSDCWPVYFRITISCGSYIDDRRRPANSAALRDSRDSAPASWQAVAAPSPAATCRWRCRVCCSFPKGSGLSGAGWSLVPCATTSGDCVRVQLGDRTPEGRFLRARHVCQHDELTGRRIPARPRITRSGPGPRAVTAILDHGGPHPRREIAEEGVSALRSPETAARISPFCNKAVRVRL